ncbi:hypothetical protein ABIB62_003418 [Mucilaginibacter sp. UYP25]|uniref:DUF4288 domain-containing protein n=1 Tax=unclassified Mucilaginibacter TaxID=2617802 RepID=UPI00339758E3
MAKGLFNIDDWELDKKISAKDTFADISIGLVYPDYHQFLEFKPKHRVQKIDEYHKENVSRLLALDLFGAYVIDGAKKRPRSVKTRVKLNVLTKLSKLDFINVTIISIDGATKIKKELAKSDTFFCVKMTVAIEIENLRTNKQDFEQRFVLINALSFEEAYEKIEADRDHYLRPYLNSDGRLVRWRIESLDDCYDVGAIETADFYSNEGIEVYSKLKTRKRKSFWDGNSD